MNSIVSSFTYPPVTLINDELEKIRQVFITRNLDNLTAIRGSDNELTDDIFEFEYKFNSQSSIFTITCTIQDNYEKVNISFTSAFFLFHESFGFNLSLHDL